jgi:hypothetical protein
MKRNRRNKPRVPVVEAVAALALVLALSAAVSTKGTLAEVIIIALLLTIGAAVLLWSELRSR